MDKRPIASDLDGTFTDHPEIRGEIDFIITANHWTEAKAKTEMWDINVPVFWNPGERGLMDIVQHKANIINKTNAQKFFENQPAQVALLKTMCPNCRIVQVEPGRNAI